MPTREPVVRRTLGPLKDVGLHEVYKPTNYSMGVRGGRHEGGEERGRENNRMQVKALNTSRP